MNPRLLELREQRGVLRAHCAAQRQLLAEHGVVLERACYVFDQARTGTGWIKRHPGIVGAAVALLVVLKPRKVWRWGQRAFWVWQGWRALRQRVLSI
jgi:hypothetical protein